MQYEPYRSYADRFNVYALCTASESSFENGGSTFFDVVVSNKNSSSISTNMGNSWKNHIFERCIGPTFIEQIHDAHIPNNTEPDVMYWDDNKQYPPFYYVHNYINQFALLVNTTRNFGDAYTNLKSGFHYFITPSDSDRAAKTFTHELGHGLLGLGDEYLDRTSPQTDITSLNVTHTHDPNNVKWKQLLGFRKTYTCNALGYGNSYNSSFECLMRDTSFPLCEVCKLQGYKRLSQLVSGKSIYVANPEVKKYTGQYTTYSEFEDTSYTGYYNFANYHNNVVLSGANKNKFGTNMNGEKIELRTIVQNLSETTERYITMKLWIKRADGSIGTTTCGNKLELTQTFTIPVWGDKNKFWPKGALEYTGSDFNSGLVNCSMIYQIPANAVLNSGDTVAFEVTDETGNVLANDNTETQVYANVNIEYKFEDGTEIPNAPKAVIPIPLGTTLNWTAPPTLLGHTFAKAEGQHETINGSGQTVTYYYTKQTNTHVHRWGEWISNGNGTHTRTCKKDGSHTETANCLGGTATCTEQAICAVCKASYGTTKPHTYSDWKEEVSATETEFGTKGHYDCLVCGKHFDEAGNEITDLKIAKTGTYKVTVTGGTISGDKEFVKAGESITITAGEPTAGKVFKGWKNERGEIVSTNKNYTFTVNNEISLTAVYDNLSLPEPETNGGEKQNNTFSSGKIAGIIIGTVVFVGIGGFSIFWFAVKKKTFADLGIAIKSLFTKKNKKN